MIDFRHIALNVSVIEKEQARKDLVLLTERLAQLSWHKIFQLHLRVWYSHNKKHIECAQYFFHSRYLPQK